MLCSTGTGGKEASLFTQEMLIMYQRLVMRTACVTVLSSWEKLFPLKLIKVHRSLSQTTPWCNQWKLQSRLNIYCCSGQTNICDRLISRQSGTVFLPLNTQNLQ